MFHPFCFATRRILPKTILSRTCASSVQDPLKERLEQLIPPFREKFVQFKKEHGNAVIGNVTVDMVLSGMRGIKGLMYDTSSLDPEEGIYYRGMSIPEMQKKLPKASGGEEPLPEGVFWLLLTGEVPTKSQVEWLSSEWNRRAQLSTTIGQFIDSLPKKLHPMTQLSCIVTALSKDSKFLKAYSEKTVQKQDFWKIIYEDAMELISKLPVIAAKIYRNTYHDGKIEAPNEYSDWSFNMATMMGIDKPKFIEYLRLYLALHADHEGGNVSAHAVHLVGSALSDPFLSFSAGINGLAGPLHGLANQEVIEWLTAALDVLGDSPTDEQVHEYCIKYLEKSVIPGYGHAVLRKTDPRFTAQLEFASKHISNDKVVSFVSQLYGIVPDILKSIQKIKNPWPNVDAHSGAIFMHYGLVEKKYFTVPFAVSRSLGVMSSLIWARALNLPIERPKSVTMEELVKLAMASKQQS